MDKYADIIDMLEKAEGPGYVLDARIHCAAYNAKLAGIVYHGKTADYFWFEREGQRQRMAFDLIEYTSSLDASIALCERMLPDMWGRKHEGGSVDDYWTYEVRVGAGSGNYNLGIHSSEAIALLLAMFRALQEQSNG